MTGRESALKKKIEAMEREQKTMRQGFDEMNLLVDAVFARVALDYGAVRPNGDRVLILGPVDAKELMERYAVTTRRTDEGFRVDVKQKEKG